MGYRSEVKFAVALPSTQAREEVMALYTMNPLVQKNDVAALWKPYDIPKAGAYLLVYEDEYVKWYGNYEDVQAVQYMSKFLDGRAETDSSFAFAYMFMRVGEETDDIEETIEWSEDNKGVGEDLYHILREILYVRVELCLDLER